MTWKIVKLGFQIIVSFHFFYITCKCQNLHLSSCNKIIFWYLFWLSVVMQISEQGHVTFAIWRSRFVHQGVLIYVNSTLCEKHWIGEMYLLHIVTTEQGINIWWQRKMAHWRRAKLIYYIYQRQILWKPVTCNSQYRFWSLSR